MRVRDFMKPATLITTADVTLEDVVLQMETQGSNSLIVVDDTEKCTPIGMVSTQNVISAVVPEYLEENPALSAFERETQLTQFVQSARRKQVRDFMQPIDFLLHPDDSITEAAAYTAQCSLRAVPVVDADGKLVGTITRTSIKRAIYQALRDGAVTLDVESSG